MAPIEQDALQPGHVLVTLDESEQKIAVRSSRPLLEDAVLSCSPELTIDQPPPLDNSLPPALPALPTLQLTEFSLCDSLGLTVSLNWLCPLLGGPSEMPLHDGTATASHPALPLADGQAVRLESTGGTSFGKARKRRPPASAERASKKQACSATSEEAAVARAGAKAARTGGKKASPAARSGCDDESEESEGEEEEHFNWACCDRCGKWRRLPAGKEYEEAALPETWFCEFSPDNKRNACAKPEERMGKNEVWGERDDESEESGGDGEMDEASGGTPAAAAEAPCAAGGAGTVSMADSSTGAVSKAEDAASSIDSVENRQAAEAHVDETKRELHIATTRVPAGSLWLRGLVVPAGKESDHGAWRYALIGPLTGWTLQHSAAAQLQSLWVRTDRAWYWLRQAPPFAPASPYRLLWRPPGAVADSALPEDSLMPSPIAFGYARAVAPPPRGCGAARTTSITAPPYTTADATDSALALCPRSFRLSSFSLLSPANEPLDLFAAMPDGLLPSTDRQMTLVGQLLPSHTASSDAATKGARPSRLWVRTLPVQEWRFELEGKALRTGGAGLPVWVRTGSSWFLLGKPKLEGTWKPPGGKTRPLSDGLLSGAFECDARPPLNLEGLPCRALTDFTARSAETGALRSLFDTLADCSKPTTPPVHLQGLVLPSGAPLVSAQDPSGEQQGVWVRSDRIVGGAMDYTTEPAVMWVRTVGAMYRLLQPSTEFAHLYKAPGSSRASPLGESGISPLLELYQQNEEHPFSTKKGAILPALRLTNFEVCDAAASPSEIFRTLPEGTLKAARTAAGAAGASDKLHVYLRAQLVPLRGGCARPWVWVGPVRAWSADYERKSPAGKAVAGLWVYCSEAAFYVTAAEAASVSEPHARCWATNDGLLVRLASEVVQQCKAHRDPRGAAKLFNTIINNAWSRLPTEVERAYGLKRDVVVYEKHTVRFLVEALEEAGHAPMAQRLVEHRNKRMVEERKPKVQRPGQAAVAPRPAESRPVQHAGSSTALGAGDMAPGKRASHGGSGAPAKVPKAVQLSSGRAAAAADTTTSTSGTPAAAKGTDDQVTTATSAPVQASAPSDVEVAEAMLTLLRKSPEALSFAQIAVSCKSTFPGTQWNLGKWINAVKRAHAARPAWFAAVGEDMLSPGSEFEPADNA